MKNLLTLILFTAIVLLIPRSLKAQNEVITKEISMKQFDKMIKTNPGTIVDVRTKGEVSKGAIPGSVNIDFFDDEFESKISKLDKSKPVYVYCASGGRSGESVEIFTKTGFKEIYDLSEGYGTYSKLHNK